MPETHILRLIGTNKLWWKWHFGCMAVLILKIHVCTAYIWLCVDRLRSHHHLKQQKWPLNGLKGLWFPHRAQIRNYSHCWAFQSQVTIPWEGIIQDTLQSPSRQYTIPKFMGIIRPQSKFDWVAYSFEHSLKPDHIVTSNLSFVCTFMNDENSVYWCIISPMFMCTQVL